MADEIRREPSSANHDHRYKRRVARVWWIFPVIALFYLWSEHQAHLLTSFLFQWPTLITLALFPILGVTYVRLARREEAQALVVFGEDYRTYMARTPGWWPVWRGTRTLG